MFYVITVMTYIIIKTWNSLVMKCCTIVRTVFSDNDYTFSVYLILFITFLKIIIVSFVLKIIFVNTVLKIIMFMLIWGEAWCLREISLETGNR